jgi:rhodanese-related sulfurtransferase
MTASRLAATLAVLAIAGCAAAHHGDPGPFSAHPFPRVTPAEARALLDGGPGRVIVLDVRTPAEFAAGHVPGAVNLDVFCTDFEDALTGLDRQLTYIVHCKGGRRSAIAAARMADLGFVNVYDLPAGYEGWVDAGNPVAN